MVFGWLNIVWVWLKQIVMLPVNLAKVASINKHLELQQQLSETQQRLEQAEQKLAKYAAIEKGRLIFSYNVYWARDANGKVNISPYCSRCLDLDGKLVRLVTRCKGVLRFGDCPECGSKDIPLGTEPK